MEILLVESEARLAREIRRALNDAGHAVQLADDGPSALAAVTGKRFDLMILAVNLPGVDGSELLARIRGTGASMPVLVLAAGTGMDDLLAKVRSLAEPVVLRIGSVCLDVAKQQVTRGGEPVDLSPKEFEVLHLLMTNAGRALSRDELCDRIWGREHDYDTRTVEMVIVRLRKKLQLPGGEPVIRTVRSVGYSM